MLQCGKIWTFKMGMQKLTAGVRAQEFTVMHKIKKTWKRNYPFFSCEDINM